MTNGVGWRRAPWWGLSIALTIFMGANAHAGDDAAAAEQLFREALKEMGQGKYDSACPRLAESQKLDPGYGTLMHLGDCYVKLGKTASAWATYREAADFARQKKQAPREKTAQQKASALESKLSKLIIDVPPETATTGLVVRRDGLEVGQASWKTPVPIDPGKHEIEVAAPGKITWKTTIEIGTEGETARVVVSPLSNEPPAKSAEEAKDDKSASTPSKKWHPVTKGGLVVAGVGVAAIGASVGLGFLSKSKNDAADCDQNVCSREGLAERSDALTIANIGTGVFIGGAVCAVAGVIMVIAAPSGKPEDAKSTALHVRVGPGMLSVGGTF